MKYYALKYQYRYWNEYNLGNDFQTFAVEHVLSELGVEKQEIDYLNQDTLAQEASEAKEPGILIVQGWFGSKSLMSSLPLFPNKIVPLYFGFHLNEGSWEYLSKNQDFISAMKAAEPIGCRDYGTRDFMRGLGISAFFSGCLTLFFPRRPCAPNCDKTYVIDTWTDIAEYIPDEIKKRMTYLNQAGAFPSGKALPDNTDALKIKQIASERLLEIRDHAALVVTGRLHVAAPCLAMGIPTIFCFEQPEHFRVSWLRSLLPIYKSTKYREINWHPDVPDLSKTQEKIRIIFTFRMQTLEGKFKKNKMHLSGNQAIIAEHLLATACNENHDHESYSFDSFTRKSFIDAAFTSQQQELLARGAPLVLFGAGAAGTKMNQLLQFFGINPACFCDNSKAGTQHDTGLPIISIEELKQKHLESVIMISTTKGNEQILEQLASNRFNPKKITSTPELINKFSHFHPPY